MGSCDGRVTVFPRARSASAAGSGSSTPTLIYVLLLPQIQDVQGGEIADVVLVLIQHGAVAGTVGVRRGHEQPRAVGVQAQRMRVGVVLAVERLRVAGTEEKEAALAGRPADDAHQETFGVKRRLEDETLV